MHAQMGLMKSCVYMVGDWWDVIGILDASITFWIHWSACGNLLYLAKCGDWTRLADVISCGCTMAFKTRIVTWDSQLKVSKKSLAVSLPRWGLDTFCIVCRCQAADFGGSFFTADA